MTDTNIVERLLLYSTRMKETRSTVLGLLLNDAADEIERLRAERDEARRLYCRAVEEIEHGMTNETERMVADYLGWDCFKENKR